MEDINLFNYIAQSFGLDGKTIKIVNKRKTSSGSRISDIEYTKDGKMILASYCDAHGDDSDAYSIYEEVNNFEKKHGDGTSLLTMLLAFFIYELKSLELTHEDIDRDIDYIIGLIKETCINDILDDETDKLAYKNWLMTTCKSDIIYHSLNEFLKDKRHINIKGIKRIESQHNPEIIFKPRSGYNIYTRMHTKFLHPSLKKDLKNIHVAIHKGILTHDFYRSLEDEAYKNGKRLIFICHDITENAEELIDQSKTDLVIVVRFPSKEDAEFIYEDLSYMFNTKPNEHGLITGIVREVKLEENSATFYGFNRTTEELIEYCKGLDENFTETEDHDMDLHKVRIANIISDNTFDIFLNPISLRRYKMLHGMVEDVVKSKHNYPKGLIVGGMHYITRADKNRTGIIVSIIKKIYNQLHGQNKFDLTKENFIKTIKENDPKKICTPVDLMENTIQIYEVLRSVLKELASTYKISIDSEFKWHGA